MQDKEEWFVYCHYKPTGEIFYVGIGRKRFGNTHYQIYKRAYEINSRNFLWKRVYNKYKDRIVRITPKPILATKDGTTLEFESSYKFMKFIGLNRNSHINECLNGKRKRVMGWELKFK